MNTIGIALGLFLFVNLIDRLRLVNWSTGRPAVIASLLLFCASALATIYEGFAGWVTAWHMGADILILIWLHVTRPQWRDDTVPDWARSDRVDLDEAEKGRP